MSNSHTYATTIDTLCTELNLFCTENNLPHLSADEIIFGLACEDIPCDKEKYEELKSWLEGFIEQWDKVCSSEDLQAAINRKE